MFMTSVSCHPYQATTQPLGYPRTQRPPPCTQANSRPLRHCTSLNKTLSVVSYPFLHPGHYHPVTPTCPLFLGPCLHSLSNPDSSQHPCPWKGTEKCSPAYLPSPVGVEVGGDRAWRHKAKVEARAMAMIRCGGASKNTNMDIERHGCGEQINRHPCMKIPVRILPDFASMTDLSQSYW